MTQLPPHSETPRYVQYLRVFALGFCAFIFNTSEFVPVGLLSDISSDFGIMPSQTGWMLTIYAWIVGLMSLPMMLITSRMERKRLLLGTCTVFVLSHGFSAIAWDFQSLLISRIGVAFSHAVFWSITASIAIRVAPPGKMNFALSVLATGTGMAMVLGVPLGRLIGQTLGWRMAFEAIGIAAFITTVAVFRLLPPLPSMTTTGLGSKVKSVFTNKILFTIYFAILLVFTAHYTSYSYIEPFLKTFENISDSMTTGVLLTFGLAGIIGSTTFGYFGEKYGNQLMIGSAAGLAVCMLVLGLAANITWLMIAVTVVWGASLILTTLSMQARVLGIDEGASDIIMSLYSGIINVGIGAGALLGSVVIERAGIAYTTYAGAFVACLSLLVIYYITKLGLKQVAVSGGH